MASIRIPLAHERRIEREHPRTASSGGLDGATEQLAQLRAERDRLRAVVATLPTGAQARRRGSRAMSSDSSEGPTRCRVEADRLRAELDGLG